MTQIRQFVREQGCPLDQRRVTQCAAESGNVPLMQWLVAEQGARCGPTTVLAAASSTVSTGDNRLAMCKYLHYSLGCAWGRGVMNAVALRGDLKLLQLLRSAGCPMPAHDVTIAAVRSDRPAVLEFVLSQLAVPRTAEQLTVLLNVAGACDKLKTAQWLKLQYSVEWPAVLKWPASTENHWSGSTLQWARQQGCASPLTWNICNRRFSQEVECGKPCCALLAKHMREGAKQKLRKTETSSATTTATAAATVAATATASTQTQSHVQAYNAYMESAPAVTSPVEDTVSAFVAQTAFAAHLNTVSTDTSSSM
jgi:hypothetical protein